MKQGRVTARRHAFSALRGYRRLLGASGVGEETLAHLDRVAQGILEARLTTTTQYAVHVNDRDVCVGQFRPWGTDDLGRPRGWVQHLLFPLAAVRRIAFFNPLDVGEDCFPDPPAPQRLHSLAEVVDLSFSEAHFLAGLDQASPAPLGAREISSLLACADEAACSTSRGTVPSAGQPSPLEPAPVGRDAYRALVGLAYLLPRPCRLHVAARPWIAGESLTENDRWRWHAGNDPDRPGEPLGTGIPPPCRGPEDPPARRLACWISDPERRERLRCFLRVLERQEEDRDLEVSLERIDGIEREESETAGISSRAASPTVRSLFLANALMRDPGLEAFARELIGCCLRDLERNPDLRVLTAALDALEEIAEEALLRDRSLEHVMPRGRHFLREVSRSLREGRYGSPPDTPSVRRVHARIDRLRSNLG